MTSKQPVYFYLHEPTPDNVLHLTTPALDGLIERSSVIFSEAVTDKGELPLLEQMEKEVNEMRKVLFR